MIFLLQVEGPLEVSMASVSSREQKVVMDTREQKVVMASKVGRLLLSVKLLLARECSSLIGQ